jgi:hypothetical protein
MQVNIQRYLLIFSLKINFYRIHSFFVHSSECDLSKTDCMSLKRIFIVDVWNSSVFRPKILLSSATFLFWKKWHCRVWWKLEAKQSYPDRSDQKSFRNY